MATAAVIARIISQYSDKGSKAAQKDMQKLTKQFDKFGKRALKSVGLAATATAGLAIKLGKDAVQGAMADEKQQAALAVALRNTTGATNEAIDANSRFLDSLELQVAIDNEELIPSLQKLVTATGNLSKAQQLLTLATDVSAASGKDLDTVSTALSKAYVGNFTALRKLGIPLDEAKIKAKDFLGIQQDLAEVSKGQAAAAANTFAGKLKILQLSFNQITDRVGYALIPVFEKLVERINKDVLPAFEKFIRVNQNDIVRAVEGSIKLATDFAEAMIDLSGILIDLEPLLKILGSGILAIIGYVKLFAATQALQGFLAYLATSMSLFKAELYLIGPLTQTVSEEFSVLGIKIKTLGRGLRDLKGVDKLSGKFRILGKAIFAAMSPALIFFAKIAIAVAAIYVAYRGLKAILEKFARDDRKRAASAKIALQQEKEAADQLNATYNEGIRVMIQRGQSSSAVKDRILADFAILEKQISTAKEQQEKDKADAARQARLLAEQIADEQKRLYIQGLERKGAAKLLTLNRTLLTDKKKMEVQLAAIKAKNAKLDKAGIKLTDPDEMTAIQMEAIYQNLVKNGKILLAEVTKQQKAADDLKLKAAEDYNKALERQADIVQYLDKLRANDIVVVDFLAKKWKMSTDAADMYIKSVLAVGQAKVDDAGIMSLRLAWGMSGDQARKYLEFTAAIKAGHGNIGKEKLEELGRKWFKDTDNPTDAARKYEEALGVLEDHEVGAKEVQKLVDSWNLSPDAVAAYLLEVGKPFTLTDDAKLILSADMVAKIAGHWDKAKIALIAYLNAAKGFKFDFPSTVDPATAAAADAAAKAAADAAAKAAAAKAATDAAAKAAAEAAAKAAADAAAKAAASKAAADAYAIALRSGDKDAAALAAAGVTPSALATQESGAIGAASIAAQLAKAEQEAIAAAMAAFKQKEAREAAEAAAKAVASVDYDERFKFKAFDYNQYKSPTSTAGSNFGGGNLMAGGPINVTLNVAGSVTTEDDLVQVVRNGLLYGQGNGYSINLQAI